MKKLLFLSLFLHIIFCAKAQPGSIDPSFNPTDIGFGFGDGANSTVRTTSIQSDGKIIIGGDFTSYNGTARNYIARLNADGTPDSTFTVGTGANWTVQTTSIQNDGKIIIGGQFTSYNGTAINRIARLNADGTLDGTFTVGTGANGYVLTTSIQSDGKIIIGGLFTSYNGTAINRIARLNADGTLDSTFTVGTGASFSVSTTSIQNDGKIIIGGDFFFYNGISRNRIARLNTDGTLDSTFNVGTGANDDVLTTSIQSDGKIIIGGWFTSYNGTGRNRIARLLNGTPATIPTSAAICSGCSILKIYPNPNTGEFNIVMNITPARSAGGQAENLELKIVNNLGQVLFREKLKQFKGIYEKQLDLNKYPVGVYNLQLISNKGVINKQIIILNN
ncbi:MAG: T9SS type A sorting domain-containing protein [Cytophagales bacterium]|nr:T9SS type A sorting domain-containing protein [Cytophagales bacterium]